MEGVFLEIVNKARSKREVKTLFMTLPDHAKLFKTHLLQLEDIWQKYQSLLPNQKGKNYSEYAKLCIKKSLGNKSLKAYYFRLLRNSGRIEDYEFKNDYYDLFPYFRVNAAKPILNYTGKIGEYEDCGVAINLFTQNDNMLICVKTPFSTLTEHFTFKLITLLKPYIFKTWKNGQHQELEFWFMKPISSLPTDPKEQIVSLVSEKIVVGEIL